MNGTTGWTGGAVGPALVGQDEFVGVGVGQKLIRLMGGRRPVSRYCAMRECAAPRRRPSSGAVTHLIHLSSARSGARPLTRDISRLSRCLLEPAKVVQLARARHDSRVRPQTSDTVSLVRQASESEPAANRRQVSSECLIQIRHTHTHTHTDTHTHTHKLTRGAKGAQVN